MQDLATTGLQPAWAEALNANPQLLGEDPGRFYGASALERGQEEFEQLRRTLDIRRNSWLVWRLVLGEIHAATDKADEPFLGLVPRLLDLLVKTPPAVNTGLSRLLDRYCERRNVSVHEGLRDYAVAQWGNPWLDVNRAKWSFVSDPAREMVAGWLKRDLIRRFFSLLAADGLNDTRRLKFWERYYASIGDMYFVLGGTALRHQGADFRKIREQMQGRLLELHSAGPRTNNAFIMCIGDHVVVEFGIKGNACYIFKREGLPFTLGGAVAGNSNALKHWRHEERLLHVDGSFEKWEGRFEGTLFRLTGTKPTPLAFAPPPTAAGARPNTAGATSGFTQPVRGAVQPSPSRAPLPKPAGPSSGFAIDGLERFCASHSLQIDDRRGQNGCLWVRTHNLDAPVTKQLQAWGFEYKNAFKGWWRQ